MMETKKQGSIELLPQEKPSGAMFNGNVFMTFGFQNAFGGSASIVAVLALLKVKQERVHTLEGADYLQVCIFNGTRFWIVDDGEIVTFLLPEEY